MKTFFYLIQLRSLLIWIYCCSFITLSISQTACPNLVPNGDFESATSSFTFGLTPNCTCVANSYCVNTNFNTKCANWPNLPDHTPTGTKFLIIDGSTSAATNVWATTVNVIPGMPYTFSFWIASVYPNTSQIFDLGMMVNGQLEHQITINQASPAWVQYSYSGICPTGVTSLSIAIRQITGGLFRDFGIDDITFNSCICDAAFVFQNLSSCGSVQFSNQSTGTPPMSYAWNFGDPGSGSFNNTTIQNPSHQFSFCGNFRVCLKITSRDGCMDSICQTVTYIDNTKPVITCPPNLTVNCNASINPSSTGFATATDNCMATTALGVSFTDIFSGSLPCSATYTRTWVASDNCNNIATCVQIIRAVDTTKPIIHCPQNITIQCNQINPPTAGVATATDNCTVTSNIIISNADALAGQAPCNLTVTRTWSGADQCNNKSTCIQVIKMVDTIPPTISCPRNPTVSTNPGECYFTGTYPTAVALDSCDTAPTFVCSLLTPTSSILITPSTQYPKGVNTITCYAIDACGNQSNNCTFTLTVEDREKPKIQCPLSMSVFGTWDALGNCKAIVNNIAPIATDNCPMLGVNYTLSGATIGNGIANASGTLFMAGVTTVHYSALDMSGNRDTCSFTINVRCESNWTCPCANGTAGSQNLVVNGNFNGGFNGFTNSYIPFTPGTNTSIGKFSVLTNSQVLQANNQWACSDHTTGTGQFLVVDGASQSGSIAWEQMIPGSDSGTFNLCFYANNLVIPSKNYDDPVLGVFINGTQVIPNTIIPENPDAWIPINVSWVGSLPATIQIRTMLNQSVGNDFAIDDISFIQCSSIPKDSCVCGSFSNLSARLFGGAQNLPIQCGDTIPLTCPQVFQLGGAFNCQGDDCDSLTKVDWDVQGPISNQGTMSIQSGFILPLNASDFASPGFYTLTLTGYCDGKPCPPCKIYFKVSGCDTCIEIFDGEPLGSTSNWQAVNGTVSIVNTIPKIPPSQVLCGLDDEDGSYMFNNIEYNGNWIQKFGANCFCFDIRYDNGNAANPATGTATLNIYSGPSLGSTLGTRATFVVNSSMAIGNAWKRVCVPIALSSGGILPGNQFGQWTSTSSAAAFDNLIQSVSGIAFVLDFAGGNHPSEKLYVDNFCIEKCPPDICRCGSFSNLSARYTGGAPNQNIQCGKTYTLKCPSAFQFSGDFKCQGNDCDSTYVVWNMSGPIGGGGTVAANSGFTLPLSAASFSINGLYTLTLVGYCEGKPCLPCIVYFEVTGCDTCCTDSTAFNSAVANFQYNGTLGNCTLSVNGIGLDSCMQVTWSWGDGTSTGPLSNGTAISHTYNGTNTYNLCYLIEEVGANGKVCWSKKICDSVYVICNSHNNCDCAGADHLSFGGHDFWLPAICGDSNVIEIPCAANGQPFYFHGNVNCKGDSCLDNKFDWAIADSKGTKIINGSGPIQIINSNTGHFDITNLIPALFTPGLTYSIIITWVCDGKKCTCNIKFRIKDCDCKCGKFDEVFLRPTHGAPSVPVSCDGDVPTVPCPIPGQPFNISGLFHCVGDSCPTNTQIDWMLLDPNGMQVDAGTIYSTPGWSLNLNNHHFGKVGTYTVMLTGHCGAKLCPCKIKFTFKEACPCDDCNCGKYSKMTIKPGNGTTKPVACGDTAVINCPGNGLDIVLAGQMQCQGDSCTKTTTLDWILINPQGGATASGIGVVVNPNFNVHVSPLLLTSSGVYTLQLIGNCGMQRCTCEIKIKMDKPCPDKCECDGFTILSAISRGPILPKNCGDTLYVPDGLNLFFSATLNCKGICPPASTIVWTLKDPNGSVTTITTIDENSFPIPGTYTLGLTGYCGNKVCKCTITFIKMNDCCKDQEIFEQHVLSAINVNSTAGGCKVTVQIGTLPTCDYIERINWGDGTSSIGPFASGAMPMHIYAASGTYAVSIIAVEEDPVMGMYCFVKLIKEKVSVNCGVIGTLKPIAKYTVPNTIRVYPNPTEGKFTLDLAAPATQGTTLRIVNLEGQVMLERKAETDVRLQSIEATSLPQGLYFLQVITEGKPTSVEKFVKQ